MTRPEDQSTDFVLCDLLAESFDLKGPVYEFDFYGGGCNSSVSEGTSLAANIRDAGTIAAANISGPSRTDRLDDLTNLPYADASAQTVLCRGALEHVFEPRRAMVELERILKPGGTFFVSVPGSRSRLGASHFWHFTPHALQRLLQPFAATLVGWQGPEEQPHTVFAVACKGPVDAAFLRGINLFPEHCRRRLSRSAARIDWIRKFKRAMVAWAFSPAERRRFADHYRVQFAIHMPVEGLSKRELLASCLGEIKSGTRLDLEQ